MKQDPSTAEHAQPCPCAWCEVENQNKEMKQTNQPKMVTNYDAAFHAGTILQSICHSLANKSGWWRQTMDGKEYDLRRIILQPENDMEKRLGKALVAEKLCLSHSELSEAMEGYRKGLMDDHLTHRLMIEVEIGDAAIRLFDLAGALGLDLGGAIAEKLQYNKARADHKPENRAKEGGKAF